jgi:iron complex outermembrane receptor protein
LFVNYNHTYTGYRFITTDESLYTLPYNLGNVQALYTFTAGAVKMQASLQVQNLWNTAYVVIAQRPMPQRYWVAGLQFEL